MAASHKGDLVKVMGTITFRTWIRQHGTSAEEVELRVSGFERDHGGRLWTWDFPKDVLGSPIDVPEHGIRNVSTRTLYEADGRGPDLGKHLRNEDLHAQNWDITGNTEALGGLCASP